MNSLRKIGVYLCILLLSITLAGKTAAEEAEDSLKVEMTGANATDKESADLLAALQKLLSGIERRNFEQIADCLSDDVIAIDEHSLEMSYGKQAVLDRIRKKIVGSKGSAPVKRLIVRDPYVHSKGDMAMISFQATKEMADDKSSKWESLCSEVFERKNGKWLVLKLRTNWKPVR